MGVFMRFGMALLLVGCSDYDLHLKEDVNADQDTAVAEPLPDTATPGDTSVPEEPENEAGAPVAVCDVSPNPVTPPFESAAWDGSESYDGSYEDLDGDGLDDGIASYYWELSDSPEGSSAALSSPNQAIVTGFTPELAGSYTARLTVTNQAGMSDTCESVLDAIPAENLWVEMFWEHSGDDMDLHLIAPGKDWQTYKEDLGAPFGSCNGSSCDCYYATCNTAWGNTPPDWGQIGSAADDPVLDLDDIPGSGPENINVLSPETSGTYTVVVHDYPGSQYAGGNNVTINIYLNGVLAWSDTREISGEDSYTPFAMIDWAAGAVIPM
jgi:hypothetical protein